MGYVNGWVFDPAREIWWAKTGPATWSEVAGTLGNPPGWVPCGDEIPGTANG